MGYRVIDRAGNVVEVKDGLPCPDGARLLIPTEFMDADQREVAAAATRDEATRDDGAQAWDEFRKRLGTPKAKRQPIPKDPSWVRAVPWQPEGKYGNDAAAAADGKGAKAQDNQDSSDSQDSAANRAARQVYADHKAWLAQARERRTMDAWRRRSDTRPQWTRAEGGDPAIGPDGSPRPVTHQDAARQAYESRSQWLQNRWKDHHRRYVPKPEQGT